MCWNISHLNPVSEKSQISSPNLQTACRNHTAFCSVGTGGSAFEQEIRRTATLYYTQSVTLSVFTQINPPHISHSCTTLSGYCSLKLKATEGNYRYLTTQGVREKVRQILNFCSPQFITQDAKIISIYILCPILHCSTKRADCFIATHCFILPCFILFYFTFQFCVPSDTMDCPR
jgi:hypothetical protein